MERGNTEDGARPGTDPAAEIDPATPDLSGWTLQGRYHVEGTIGHGGMGTVYVARQLALDREVALKIIKPEFARRELYLERFLREARVSSKIQHPNVVQVMDFGQLPGGSVYFVMELLRGQTLGALLKARGPLPWEDAREILRQVIRGLGEAHRHGVVHRDVKPANVFLVDAADHGWRVKVLDFGIAKVLQAGESEGLTSTNEVLGTAAFMAPEQAYARTVDARTDVYAVGILAYAMLAGRVPFKGDSAFEVLTRHVNDPPPPIPGIAPEVEACVGKALAKRPEDRYASMDEFEKAVTAAWDPGANARTAAELPRSRSGTYVALALLALVLLGAGAWAFVRSLDANEATAEPDASAAVDVQPPAAGEQRPDAADEEPPDAAAKKAASASGAAAAGEEQPAAAGDPQPAAVVTEPEVREKPPKATRRDRRQPKKSPPKKTPPKAPTDRSIKKGLAAKIKQRCAAKANGSRVEVRFSILSSGKPSLPRALPPHRSSALGQCASKIVAQATFPAGALRAGKITIDF